MSRARTIDSRFDFRGGVNSSYSEDILSTSEIRRGQNARSLLGDIEKRPGSQRLHVNAIGGGTPAVRGLFQWEAPAGSQLVAIANGNFYHKLLAAADFTEIVPASSLSPGVDRTQFSVYRTGSTNKLFITNEKLSTWDGTTLVVGIAGGPFEPDSSVLYKLRMYAINNTKTLFGSKIGNPLLWSVADGGFSVDIETYDSAQNVGLIVVGSSLLIFKRNNIARFTGVDTSNIRVDVETEGVSNGVGLHALGSLVIIEEEAFFMSDRGPYFANESGVKALGLKVSKEFTFDSGSWEGAVAVHHRGRHEIWLSIPAGGGATNSRTWIYNYRTETWSGPFIFSFDIKISARYERADKSESVMVGGYDGLIRDADVVAVGAKDDVLRDGTGGTNVVMDIELPPLLGGAPDTIKSLRAKNKIEADLGAAGSLVPYWSSELSAGSTLTVATKGAGVHNYVYKFANAKGARIVHGLRESTATIVRILGVLPRLVFSRQGR